jgi:ABC-type molybdate transport system ATPase subunit
MTAQPALTHAREAADAVLLRHVTDGRLGVDAACEMSGVGFNGVVNMLAGLRRDGVPETRITELIRVRLERAEMAGDVQRRIGAELMLAVWDGMRRDLADFLNATEGRP